MKQNLTSIDINGIKYVPESDIKQQAISENYVIVRGDRSGIFAGNLKTENGQEVTLLNVRRIWYWSGASSISELAVKGISEPDDCKFPCEVQEIRIKDAIEVIPATEEAEASIKNVPIWTQH